MQNEIIYHEILLRQIKILISQKAGLMRYGQEAHGPHSPTDLQFRSITFENDMHGPFLEQI